MDTNEQAREVRRLRKLLGHMMELANHVEQTGSFESGARSTVKRYNAMIERLEDIEAIPDNMFPRMEEESDFGRLGAECTLLAGYLEDLMEEEEVEIEEPRGGRRRGQRDAGLGELVALAPFLGSQELSKLMQSHFGGKKGREEREDEEREDAGLPDLKHLIALAPHMESADLETLVLACLSRQPNLNPKYLTALAPHLSSQALGRILHEYLPDWFQQKPEKPEQEEAEKPQPESEEKTTGGGDSWTSLTRISPH